ncbi:LamG-like jellyroll fold domain-containing protein [Carboxylicivirga taeanensis]|uniref:LamG-like jellyroll fold domain-containing protein n=1 Tax=Carboxylicivirga taeanensis TaxID=1416875 RepID=UPI003F6E0C22
MNKLLVLFFAMCLSVFNAAAQVDNYALKLSSGGSVSVPAIDELNQLDSYTLQFWMNPDVWTNGATILARGNGAEEYSIKLASENNLTIQAGAEQLTITSPLLTAGSWNQVSVVYEQGNADIFINNEIIDSRAINLNFPASNSGVVVGGNNYEGRIDELRIWKAAITDNFFQLWRNTVNKHHPNYKELVVYYKFDQNLCPDVVDYCFKHHGSFQSGAERQLVNDNTAFKYRRSVAYSDFGRWADREIDHDKYLLSNDLILLSISTDKTGKVTVPFPYNEGQVSNGNYLGEYQGRKGVLALHGQGAQMNVGPDALNPNDKYSFSTWIYLEEWTEGAYIFKKEKSPTEGFSIRLGDEAKKRIYVRVNGVDYSRINYMKVGEWVHLGVAAYSTVKNQVYQTTFNGETYYAVNNNQEVNSYTLTGLEETPALIGVNLNAKFDETVLWNAYRSSGNMAAAMTDTPMPSDTRKVEAQTLFTVDSYWNYDNPDNVGYDSYSAKHFINIMRDHYKGHRGYKIRGGLHSFSGWENAFADPAFRSTFASEIARVAEQFDGIDLDFEWCYSGACWEDYGKVIEEIRAQFPADKILTVTPHYVSYELPYQYVDMVDYFPFQIYGPGKHVFLWETYQDALTRFTANGRYPLDKIVLSYATTTSRGYDPATDAQLSVPPIGVRNGLLDGGYTPDMNSVIDATGNRRYITGYNQVIDRCEFIHDNDLGGIMYWDMGNDVKTSHPYSLVKAASYSLHSNVDTLVTDVNSTPTAIPNKPVTQSSIRVYPNPATNYVNVELPEGEEVKQVVLVNSGNGKIINRQQQTTINTSDVSKGMYILKVTSQSGKHYQVKVVIE